MKNTSSRRRIYVVIAALLVAALVGVTVFVAIPRETPPAGYIDSQAFSDDVCVRYSIEVTDAFNNYIVSFQNNLVNAILLFFGFESEGISLSGHLIAELITEFYLNAGIPGEKLVRLGEVLASFTPNELCSAGVDTLMFFIDITPITEEQAEETYVECSNCGELEEGQYSEETVGADGEVVYTCKECFVAEREADVERKLRYLSSFGYYCTGCSEYLWINERTGSDEKGFSCKKCGSTVEKRTVVVSYSSIETMAARFAASDPWGTWQSFAEKTMLSTDETARLLYQAVYLLRNEEQQKIMDEFGRQRFSDLVVAIVTVSEGISAFAEGAGSLIEARALASLAYEAGAMLDGIIGDIGADKFLRAFGLKGYRTENQLTEFFKEQGVDADTIAEAEKFNDVMSAADEVIEFLLHFAAGALLASDTPLFDSVYYASVATSEQESAIHRDFYALEIAKCLTRGLDRALGAGTEIDSDEDAAEKIASVFEKLSLLEEGDESVSEEELMQLFSRARALSALEASSPEELAASDAESRAKVTAFIECSEALVESGKLSSGLEIFGTSFVANVVFDALLAAYEQVKQQPSIQ